MAKISITASYGYFAKVEEEKKNTLQNTAVEWILHNDKYQMDENDVCLIQRCILTLFYFSTNGLHWAFCSCNSTTIPNCAFTDSLDAQNTTYPSKQFLSNTTECHWFGVICNDRGYVHQFLLHENNLTTTSHDDTGMPSELHHLR